MFVGTCHRQMAKTCQDASTSVTKDIFQAYESKDYRIDYYKKSDYIGVLSRGKKGKHLFSFGAGLGLGEKRLRSWADDVLKELDKPQSPQDVKVWIDEQLS